MKQGHAYNCNCIDCIEFPAVRSVKHILEDPIRDLIYAIQELTKAIKEKNENQVR